ncbi:MAG: ATP-binding protein [candidate division WOR-3 bacterium]
MNEKLNSDFPIKYFNYLIENLPEGIWIEDNNGQIIFANKQIVQFCGFRADWELVGKTWREIILPSEIQWIEEYLRSIKQSIVTLETLLKTPSGPMPVKLFILPLKEANKIVGRACSVLPIEKTKKTETKPSEVSDLLQDIIENAVDGICILENHSLTFVNRRLEEMTGYSSAELNTLNFENIFPLRERKKIEKILHSPQTIIMPVHYEVKLLNKVKREIDTELRVVPIERNRKKVLLCFFRDITQIKELERMRTDFIAMVSHELRTPLTAIKEAISLLSTAAVTKAPELPVRFINIAKEEIGRLNRMIDNLVEVSRIESGKVKMKLEPVKINFLIDAAVESLEVLAEKKKIKITKNLAKDLPIIMGDSDRIFHLISNILDNAIKFTPRGGSVTIATEKIAGDSPIIKARRLSTNEDYVMVSISDTGPGIAPQNLDRIFEKFERIETPAGSGEVGIGLGLTIARNTVELHRGKIWVTSEVGKGSVFYFVLPTNIRAE